MIALTRRNPLPAIVTIIAAVAMIAVMLGVPNAHAAAYKSCSLSDRDQDPPGDVPTYNLTVKQQRTTCATAKKVAKAFHKCRAAAGFTCTKRLLSHWTCTGRKSSSTPVTFYASFTCKWGVRRVTSQYQQNT